ncbi:acetyl-CoA synthetase-like protein [Ceratobasidium sp. AG-I]|nr:acetyl-CoA synthetase-like protein [Ceratobasidium sp. AG-I]
MAPNIITSPAGPLPPLPEVNFIYTLLHAPSPPRPVLPDDYVTHIDGITGEKRTRKEYVARVNAVGGALLAPKDQGGLALSPKQDVIGILSDNCIDYPIIVFASLQTTIPLALLNSHSTAPELVHQLKLARVTHLVVGPTSVPVVKKALKLAGLSKIGITILEGGGAKAREGEVSLQRVINRTKKQGVQPAGVTPAKRDTLAYLVFSSGTSGLPKAVMISHGNLNTVHVQTLLWAFNVLKVFQPPMPVHTEHHVSLGFLPMYHTMGLHIYIFRHFNAPSALVVLPSWNAETVLDCIRKYRVTGMALVPSLVFQLLAHPKLRSKDTDLSSLLGIGSGAAYLPPATEKELLDVLEAKGSRGAKLQRVTSGYGLSESTIAVMAQPLEGMFDGKYGPKPGSAGVLLQEAPAGTPMEDLVDVRPGEPGELYVRGGNNALGYLDNEKATRETFLPGGWMRTGDRFAYREGHFWFQDRSKDTLKVSGVQVSPTEIEAVLQAHPNAYLSDACVAGVPGDRDNGELVPRAWVVLSPAGHKAGVKKVIADLNEWVQGELSKPKQLRGGIEVVKSIPKNPTGKVLRRVLQERHAKTHGKVKAKL